MSLVVIIFGLAGCGKSTLANGVGRELGLRVIHPSGIMRDLMEKGEVNLKATRQNDGYWESEQGARILHERLSEEEPVDLVADRILLEEVEKGEVVIDSWSLPWLSPKGVKIRLLASLDVRARRAALRGGLTVSEARARIAGKDEDTRQLFLRLYGFDIVNDLEGTFHHTIDSDNLTAEQVLSQALHFLEDKPA